MTTSKVPNVGALSSFKALLIPALLGALAVVASGETGLPDVGRRNDKMEALLPKNRMQPS